MEIRAACKKDIPRILVLLEQIAKLHAEARPEIFRRGTKFSFEDVEQMLSDPNKPIFVAVEEDLVLGYIFCVHKEIRGHGALCDRKVLYIDDLCVDESYRGKGIGKALYDRAINLALETDCFNVELNVWAFNASAIRFYEKCGMKPQRMIMESEMLQNSR